MGRGLSIHRLLTRGGERARGHPPLLLAYTGSLRGFRQPEAEIPGVGHGLVEQMHDLAVEQLLVLDQRPAAAGPRARVGGGGAAPALRASAAPRAPTRRSGSAALRACRTVGRAVPRRRTR